MSQIDKRIILEQMVGEVDINIEAAVSAINSARESMESDSKSSAGDKYETGRAMLHIEIQNNEVQLAKSLDMKRVLLSINADKRCEKVEFGAYVITNNGNYFLSAPIGSLKNDLFSCFAISMGSPLGASMKGKVTGDSFVFNKKSYSIVEIL